MTSPKLGFCNGCAAVSMEKALLFVSSLLLMACLFGTFTHAELRPILQSSILQGRLNIPSQD